MASDDIPDRKRLARRPPRPGYEVGYGKPPDATRFQPGRSGNPKGRPKGSRNKPKLPRLQDERLKTIILEEAYRTVTVNDGSRQVGISKERPPYCSNPMLIKPRADKITRAAQHSATFEAGQVHFPADAPWLDDLQIELMQFPGSRHDDQVDSITQFLNWQIHRGGGLDCNRPVSTAAMSA
jgi:hypothetical protein